MGRELWFETDVKIIYLITKLQNCQNSMDRFQDFTIPLYKSVAPFIFPWMVCLRFVFLKCPWYNATYYKHGNCTSTSEDHKANTFVYTGIVLQGMGQMIKYLRHDSFCLSVFFPSVLHSATSALRIRCERMWHYAGLSLSLLEAGSITLTYFTHSPGSMSHTSMPKDVSLQWCDFEPIGVSIDASCATSYFSNPYRDVLKPWDYYPLTISVIFVSLKNMHLFSPFICIPVLKYSRKSIWSKNSSLLKAWKILCVLLCEIPHVPQVSSGSLRCWIFRTEWQATCFTLIFYLKRSWQYVWLKFMWYWRAWDLP